MALAPQHPDDAARLAALRSYEILDTDPESEYDEIAHLAGAICDMPVALISFGLAGYHAGVEWQLWEGPAGCTASLAAGASAADLVDQLLATPVVRCDDVPWSLFGLSMAGWNMLFSLDISAVALLSFILGDRVARRT